MEGGGLGVQILFARIEPQLISNSVNQLKIDPIKLNRFNQFQIDLINLKVRSISNRFNPLQIG